VRQLVVESVILGRLSGLAGVAIAWSGVHLLVLLSPPDLPRLGDVRIDGAVLAFVTIVSLMAGLSFGLVPALQVARSDVNEGLKAGRGTTADRRQGRLRDLLVGSEIALALVLLAGAGLMVRSMSALQSIDPGFDPRRLLTMEVSVQGTANAAPARRAVFYQELIERLRRLPDVQGISAINHLPLGGDFWTRSFAIEGRPAEPPGEGPHAAYRVVLPDYFRTMGLRLTKGPPTRAVRRESSS
jgi:putative ABC transport system permease protein